MGVTGLNRVYVCAYAHDNKIIELNNSLLINKKTIKNKD